MDRNWTNHFWILICPHPLKQARTGTKDSSQNQSTDQSVVGTRAHDRSPPLARHLLLERPLLTASSWAWRYKGDGLKWDTSIITSRCQIWPHVQDWTRPNILFTKAKKVVYTSVYSWWFFPLTRGGKKAGLSFINHKAYSWLWVRFGSLERQCSSKCCHVDTQQIIVCTAGTARCRQASICSQWYFSRL